MNKIQECEEEDCHETEWLVECRLPIYKGDFPLWYVLRFYGWKSAWQYWRRGWLDTYEYFCASHCQKNGFCYGCGEFWAGSENFDFGPGYCSNCASEFEDNFDDDNEDYYEPPYDEYEAEPDYPEDEAEL
jgi:hypothetical protein